ncbi:MAG TPA: ABC transporter permease, partial [Vicinamibacterales bacterium]|nr:ABC transporter permease [Vicinamibacterales bacterium]
RVDLGKHTYSPAEGRAFQQDLLERMHRAPGIDAAGFALTLPLNDGRWENPIRREGDPIRVQAFQNIVSERYFETLRIPLVAGRGFSSHDDQAAPKVVILNQALARTIWPNDTPLGKRLTFKGDVIEVVGVVRDIKGRNLFEPAAPMFYLPLSQYFQQGMVLHVRGAIPPAQIAATVRREIAALDRDVPVYAIKMLDEHVAATLTPQRLLAHLMSGFALLALVLAGIGLYALIAHIVTERTREIGIRMALGAYAADVIRLFVMRGLQLALAGIVLGLAAAAAVMQLMKNLLFGVSPVDPLTLTIVPLILIATALTACAIPAYRAARTDPKIALRYE